MSTNRSEIASGPPDFNLYVAAVDPTQLAQDLHKGCNVGLLISIISVYVH